MLSGLAFTPLLFFALVLGIGWPLVLRLPLAATEKLLAAVVLSLVGIWLFAWVVYVEALPLTTLWILLALATAGLALGWRGLIDLWGDTDARSVVLAQLLVTAWCLGWLLLVVNYAGGGWAGDWFEHWERTRFFIERWPVDRKFIAVYSLPARPPLANVVTGALLVLTRADFAHYQLFSTLLASLVFLPAALLARRFARRHTAIAVCALLFMVNPLFVQNATFAWTKLPAAFFVLAALYFFLRAQEPGAPPIAARLFAASLAAGLLTHYSVGVYAVALAAAWFALGWRQRDSREWQRATAGALLIGTALLAGWFGWAFATYGAGETLGSNSSVSSLPSYHGNHLVRILLNLRDTIVPHFFRRFDMALIAQRSPWGWWSDWFFQLYQLNLLLACGSVAWLAIGWELVRAARRASPRDRFFWGGFVAIVVFLGVAVNGGRDEWGLTHICLQALVLLGLAFLAARWTALSRPWRLALLSGATVDFALGIALHFGVQNFAWDRWFAAGRSPDDLFTSYTECAVMNLLGKLHHHLAFLSDAVALPPGLVLGALVVVFLATLTLVSRATRPDA